MHIYIVFKRKETDNMALEFAKELLGDAYTGELEEKLEAKINELYAPRRTWTQHRRVPTACRNS